MGIVGGFKVILGDWEFFGGWGWGWVGGGWFVLEFTVGYCGFLFYIHF